MMQPHDSTGAQDGALFLRFGAPVEDLERLMPLLEDAELSKLATMVGREIGWRAMASAASPTSLDDATWLARFRVGLGEVAKLEDRVVGRG
jgi:hypothetical protein